MSAVEVLADEELRAHWQHRTAEPASALQLQTLDEFVQRPSLSYLVRGILPAQSIVVVYGAPKSGKSFCMVDLLMHAAHGQDWHGHKVTSAVRVALGLGEGIAGSKVRLRGWIEQHDNIEQPGEIRILPEALSLPENAGAVVEALRSFAPDIVVLDTLNAFFGAGDENSTQDMTKFVSAVRYLRDELKCCVCIIHHTGHGNQDRERGSIALRGTADVMIQVGRDESGSNHVGFQVVGARDMESMSEALALKLRHVETSWLDDDGQPLATCIVEAADGPVTLAGRSKPLGSAQAVVLEAARKLAKQRTPDARGEVLLSRLDVAAVAKEQGVSRQSISSAWQALAGRKYLRLVEPGSVLVKVKP